MLTESINSISTTCNLQKLESINSINSISNYFYLKKEKKVLGRYLKSKGLHVRVRDRGKLVWAYKGIALNCTSCNAKCYETEGEEGDENQADEIDIKTFFT